MHERLTLLLVRAKIMVAGNYWLGIGGKWGIEYVLGEDGVCWNGGVWLIVGSGTLGILCGYGDGGGFVGGRGSVEGFGVEFCC